MSAFPGQMSSKGDEMAGTEMLERRIDNIEQGVIPRLALAIDKLTDSLQKLTAIDERQTEFKETIRRAFTEIKEREQDHRALDERLRKVELQLPTLNLIKNWVITGVISMVGLFLLAAAVLIFKLPVH